MLHLCVGFYPNGDFVVNTVCDKNLQSNIEYNKTFRPGRFYFVDGAHVCGGLLGGKAKDDFIQDCKERMEDLNLKAGNIDSSPYL